MARWIRAQSAMEYLTTYGWAILIIGVVIALLAAMGVFSPNTYVSNSCLLPAQFRCITAVLSANGILSISMQQNTGDPINVTALYCNSGQSIPTNTLAITKKYPGIGGNAIYLGIGGNATFSVPCFLSSNTEFSGTIGTIYQGYLLINYTDIPTSFMYTTAGSLVLKVAQVSTTSIIASLSSTSISTSISSTTLKSSTTTTTIPYVPLTLTNSQSTATSSNFQQSVTVTPSACSGCYPYINANWSNVEFSTGVGSSGPSGPLDAWIESGASNTAASTLIWVNLTSSTIAGSGGTLTIYMSFMPTTSPVTSGYTGYAPQFFCASGCAQTSYGQYDNGESVFTYYQPFGGLSTLPTGWTLSAGADTFLANYTTINDIGTTRAGLYSNVVSTEQVSNFPVNIDVFSNLTRGVVGSGADVGEFGLSSGTMTSSTCGIAYYTIVGVTSANKIITCTKSTTTTGNTVSSLIPQVYSLYIPSNLSFSGLFSYSNPITGTITAVGSGNDIKQSITTSSNTVSMPIYWIRTREPPPNNIQPAVSFGSFV